MEGAHSLVKIYFKKPNQADLGALVFNPDIQEADARDHNDFKFQGSQGYKVRACLKRIKKKER